MEPDEARRAERHVQFESVVAAAGIAMLSQIADGKLHEKANALGAELRGALNDVFRKAGAPIVAYGDVSICHISLDGPPAAPGRALRRRRTPGSSTSGAAP